MFEPAIDRLGGPIRRAGPVEVGQHVRGSLLQGATEGDHLDQRAGDTAGDLRDELFHQASSRGWIGGAVGGDHVLVDAPGRFDLDVVVVAEQGVQAGLLFGGEQTGARVEGPAGAVEGVAGPTPVAVDLLLDPAPATVQGIPGEPDDVERVMPTSA